MVSTEVKIIASEMKVWEVDEGWVNYICNISLEKKSQSKHGKISTLIKCAGGWV